jgi:excisionase family DNA binding protein
MTDTDTAAPRLLSIVAAAKAMGVSRGTMFTLLDSGRLAYVRIGRRRLIPVDAIERFIDANLVAKGRGNGGRAA